MPKVLQRLKQAGLARGALIALGSGLAGAFLGRTFDIPGGAFTGAMLLSAVAALSGLHLQEPPRWLAVTARIALGLTTGAAVTVETIHAVARAALPVGVMVMAMMTIGLTAAWALHRFTRMSLPTALCGAAPGALSAMVALADDLKGDTPTVASLHLVRLVSVLLIMPILATTVFAPSHLAPSLVAIAPVSAFGSHWVRLLLLLGLGLGVGFWASRHQFPAGDFLAGMLVAAALNPTLLHLSDLPSSWKLFAQWIIGCGVGASVTRETLRQFKPYALAGGLMTAFLILAGMALGWLLWAITDLDLLTCILGTSPGGATTLIILADELGADAQLVSAMHVSRMIIIMLLLPALVRLAVRLGEGKPIPFLHRHSPSVCPSGNPVITSRKVRRVKRNVK
ncbi:MAG: AbrB family transcriptional regulator [Chloroflexi bacterium]|nr:AbrB family transcriptional regulator [Chloroflexota bacterium]